ncbi:alpha/beta hydrolase [Spirilliplanes yamanashiensis]|uniref:Esterase n=1 Tax=Spirilliplanes yamanashiensis TaxID=42233 RepID=A0A8J3Y464_9ACTN|nr:alpha/beta hydrolase fold domain-containing protein [Spirilliplanes yamanashiensis]MDP9820090.1 acetyl esterase/lipase [Spirilliplanes yamanashiensis]GIJ01089.1 esterase [Spirilliplanes yamanashiensis]
MTPPPAPVPVAVPAGLAAECRAFYAARGERRGPASFDEVLAARAAQVPPAVAVERVSPLGVAVRVVRPAGVVRGVLLDIPGGGFYLGASAGGIARAAEVAGALGVAVVSVDHRLAPEEPWPAAPDDCEAAARWLIEHAQTRFGTSALAVVGSSAGATLATTTLLRLRDRGLAGRFAAAVLQFGVYDLSGSTPAGRLIAGEYFLDAYLGHVADRTVPDVSPVFGDLRGLPPALLIVGERDVLLADNRALAARLAAAGVDVELLVYPEAPHGFTEHPTGMARAALADRDRWLAGRLARGGPPALSPA